MSNFISNEFLEELKSRINIVNVVSKYIPLEKKGNNYWGRCPFHLEKTPSFSVNERDQFYHCFGCKASGNVIKFIMEMESVSFIDAVRILAEGEGMQMPTIENSDDYEEKKKHRQRLVLCMKEGAKHYHDNLANSPEATAYLKNRGISNEMITRFGIGYSKDAQDIISFLESKGFSKQEMLDCGIIKEKDGRLYDTILKRIAFPVINIYGDVVAFSGRTMQKDVDYAKYLNTAETDIFSKSKNLFGINLVKKAKQNAGLKEIIIVEGQIDVISLHQAGFSNAVASLGTALTNEQAKMIKRLADNVVICYDGDFAGVKATLRGLDILKQEGLNVRVAKLPEGMDPDDLVKKRGGEAFRQIIDDALPLIEFKLKYLKTKYNLKEFDGKAKYIEEAIEVLKGLGDVEAEVYLALIKDIASVNIEFLRDKLRKDNSLQLSQSNLVTKSNQLREEKKDNILLQSKYCVLANMLVDRSSVMPEFDQYFDEPFVSFIRFLREEQHTRKEFISTYEELYPEEVGEIVNFVFSENEKIDREQFEDCMWNVQKSGILKRKEELALKLENATGEERKSIMQEIMQLTHKMNNRS